MRSAQVLTQELRGEKSGLEDGICRSSGAGREHFSRLCERVVRRHALANIFFSPDRDMDVMRNICSVLAGYVWDKSNPYVTQAERALSLISKFVTREVSRNFPTRF